MHLVPPPPKKKLSITIVFDFSWDDCNTLENLETMVMQNSEGETRCIMVYVKVVITRGRDVKRALGYLKGTPRQNAIRMSTKFNIRSAFYFRSSI